MVGSIAIEIFGDVNICLSPTVFAVSRLSDRKLLDFVPITIIPSNCNTNGFVNKYWIGLILLALFETSELCTLPEFLAFSVLIRHEVILFLTLKESGVRCMR